MKKKIIEKKNVKKKMFMIQKIFFGINKYYPNNFLFFFCFPTEHLISPPSNKTNPSYLTREMLAKSGS